MAFERWKIAKVGGDPRKEDGKAALAPTFAEAAEAVIAMHTPTLRSPKSGPAVAGESQDLRLPEHWRTAGVGNHAGARHGGAASRSGTTNVRQRGGSSSASRRFAVGRRRRATAIRNKAEAAYARSDLFEKRRLLMEAWATYLGS